MWPFNQKKILLGDENNEVLLKKLRQVLKSINATHIKSKQYVVGSQDIIIELFEIDNRKLKIITETYEGIIIKGHKDLVTLISKKITHHSN